MKLQNRSRLEIPVILLLVILQNAMGMDYTPYIQQRKKMLEEMKVDLHPRPKGSKVDAYYYKNNVKSEHNYNITINEPDLCTKDRSVFLLILIRTHFAHRQWREIAREMLNHDSPMPHQERLVVKHLFIFGKSNDPHIENLLRNESKHHKDIIQEDFQESYVNLLKKVVTAWKWTVNFCPNAEYVMIINDEVLIDVEKILYYLLKEYSIGLPRDRFAICYAVGNARANHFSEPAFRKMDRKLLYKGKYYPPYCHGFAYAAHINVINKLYKASFTNPPFMPTDVWIGVLAEKLRLKTTNGHNQYVLADIERYFEDPFYPILPGMIAVTDEKVNKHHEYEVMKKVIQNMRRHWKMMTNITIHLTTGQSGNSATFLDSSTLYIAIPIFTISITAILATIMFRKIIKILWC